MNKYNVPDQPRLNLDTTQFSIATNRTTREVCQLIQTAMDKHVTSQEVLHQGKAGNFELPYAHGLLIVSPSNQGRPNRLWHWDVSLVPTVVTQRFNLDTTQFSIATNRTTREVYQLIQTAMDKHVTSQEVLHQGKAGNFELPYAHGLLIVSPSSQGRPNRLWRWDVSLVPAVVTQRSA